MNIAFIIGCARSGTSILGELIAAHPDVRYIFEAHHVWEVAGPGEGESDRLTEKDATPSVIKFVRGWFMSQQGSAILTVEKNPRNVLRIPYIKRIFPEAKIIHIVRDGRDVACSMLPGIGGTEWLHLKPPAWKNLRHEPEIVRCAKVWRDTVQIALSDLEGIPHLSVKYEALVSSPHKTALAIMKYLDLKEDQRVNEFCMKIQNATHGSYHAQHQLVWYRNNHSLRIGRWRENLTPDQQQVVQGILEESLRMLGYQSG